MALLEKALDKSVPIPLYFQLKRLILEDIESGELKEGDHIPTEMELANHFRVSRSTVRQAVTELSSEGRLSRMASKGTFVTAAPAKENYIRPFEPVYQQIARQNDDKLTTELLKLKVIPATEEIAGNLGLHPGDQVISMLRRRLSDRVPMMTVQNYIPYDLCSYIVDADFTTQSLYGLLMTHEETKIAEMKSIVSAGFASTDDVKLLQITKTTPVLCFHNISHNKNGNVLDYAFARYRGDMHKFEVINTNVHHI